jgi:hypothetical protein
MAPWKPPAMIGIIIALAVAVITVSRAMGDDGGAAQTAATFGLVTVAFVLIALVSAVGAVRRPFVVTGLVMVSVTLVSIAPLGMVIGVEAYRQVVVRPICEKLETDTTRFDYVSGTADGFTSIERYFTRRLECHYRTADPSVPEGIPTSVDVADDRLAGNRAGLVRSGHIIAGVVGFFLFLFGPFPIWRWWFRSMMREMRKQDDDPEAGTGDGSAGDDGTALLDTTDVDPSPADPAGSPG